MIDDLLAARDDLEQLLDRALPALEERPGAEATEVLAVLLVAPLRTTGPSDRLRRLVVRGLEQRGTPVAASVLEAVAALADPDIARRAREALDRLRERGVHGSIDGIGATELETGWRVPAPGDAEALAAIVRRPGEPGGRLLKLWLEPGDEAHAGVLAGGWTEPADERRLGKERDRFARMAASGGSGSGAEPGAESLDAAAVAAELDRIVRRSAELGLPLAEGVALILAQLRRAAGEPEWPAFDVVAVPEPPAGRRSRRR